MSKEIDLTSLESLYSWLAYRSLSGHRAARYDAEHEEIWAAKLKELIETQKNNSLRECLADYAHRAWSGWMEYLFGKCIEVGDDHLEIPKYYVERWTRQMRTSYANLSEEEKDSDRKEADAMLEIFLERMK